MNRTGLIILIVVLACVVVFNAIGFVVFFYLRKRSIKKSNIEADKKVSDTASSLALTFGGKDNIKNIEVKGSRVSIYLLDDSKINKDEIKKLFPNPIFMSNRVIFVVGSKALEFKEEIENKLK